MFLRHLGRANTTVQMERHTVGNALVLHLHKKISTEAQSMALFVPPDPDNDIVVLDVAGESDAGVWEAAAAALPWRRRGIRLIVCGMAAENAALAGQWLAQRLRRPVVAPRGHVIRASGGTLFVHSDSADGEKGSGWIRHERGKEPVWEAKRFPRPQWDTAAIEHRTTSATAVAEPLPGGVWLHDERGGAKVREHWKRLVTKVPTRTDRMAVVLGCPGTPALSLDEIARFWRGLGEEHRQQARFVQYGPVESLTGDAPVGQLLADLLGQPVTCYAGLPVETGDDATTMYTVDRDGGLGWPVFATELRFHTRPDRTRPAAAPSVLTYRVPPELSEEVSPRIYWYANDAVVEVIPAGLWMRPTKEPEDAAQVRRDPLRPDVHALVFDDTVADRTDRMRSLAEDLAARLEPAVRGVNQLVPMSAVVGGGARRTTLTGNETAIGSLSDFQGKIADEIARMEGGLAAGVLSTTDELPIVQPRPAAVEPPPPTAIDVQPLRADTGSDDQRFRRAQ